MKLYKSWIAKGLLEIGDDLHIFVVQLYRDPLQPNTESLDFHLSGIKDSKYEPYAHGFQKSRINERWIKVTFNHYFEDVVDNRKIKVLSVIMRE